MKLVVVGALMLGWAVLSPGCGQSWNEGVAAAKKEATVTVYHSQLGAPHWNAVVDAFQKKYGIEVKEFDARASEITERVRVEQSSGRAIADVEFHGLATIVDQRKSNFIAELGAIPNAKNIRPDVPPADKWEVPAWNQFVCTLTNTKMITPADEPKTYSDFLKPGFKDKMLSDDMAAIG